MLSFTTYRCADDIFINKTHHYKAGEILCSYLNQDMSEVMERRALLEDYQSKLSFPTEMSRCSAYKINIHIIQKIYSFLDKFAYSVEPFSKLDPIFETKLIDYLRQNTSLLTSDSDSGAFSRDQSKLKDINDNINALYRRYVGFCDDILRVSHVFSDFLDNYFYTFSSFPNPGQTAQAFRAYSSDHQLSAAAKMKYLCFVPIVRPLNAFELLEVPNANGNASEMLCEVTRFYDIGSFLALEFFCGIESGRLPKRCACCGKYFLPDNGHYPEFCSDIAPGESYKTCREIGARKKYNDKVRSNPVWLQYQRAYKTHYARYMKKKMTSSEFEEWSQYASNLRDSMLSPENLPENLPKLSLDEYSALLKK